MPDMVTCPSCNTTLRPKTPVAAGTRIKCPKCQTVFTVPADEGAAPPPTVSPPAAVSREPEPAADNGGDFAAIGDADAGGPAARPPAKKGVPLWVWLTGGGVLALLLGCCGCVGVGYYFVSGVVQAGSGSVTLLNYAQVQKGMSEGQVQGILGTPTQAVTQGNTKVTTWTDGDNKITVTFNNGAVSDRTCRLLTKGGTPINQTGFTGQQP